MSEADRQAFYKEGWDAGNRVGLRTGLREGFRLGQEQMRERAAECVGLGWEEEDREAILALPIEEMKE